MDTLIIMGIACVVFLTLLVIRAIFNENQRNKIKLSRAESHISDLTQEYRRCRSDISKGKVPQPPAPPRDRYI